MVGEDELMDPLNIKWIGCAKENFRPGRAGFKPLGICIHLMDGYFSGIDAWFNNRSAQVSAHYAISQKGEIHQYVKEEDRAFHAGVVAGATFPLVVSHPGVNPNLTLIGIEHEGKVTDEWSTEMMAASAHLISDICKRWNIPIDADHIGGHHSIYNGHVCPGPKCDLEKLIAMAVEANASE